MPVAKKIKMKYISKAKKKKKKKIPNASLDYKFSHQDHQEIWFEISPMGDPIKCYAITSFFFFLQSSNELTWCETKAKIISSKNTHTH